MGQKKRSDKNSVTAALGGFRGAIAGVPVRRALSCVMTLRGLYAASSRAHARERTGGTWTCRVFKS